MDSAEKKLKQFVGGKPDLLQNMPSMRTFLDLAGIKDWRREVLLKTLEVGIPYDMTRKKHLTGEDVSKYKEIFVNAGLTEANADYAIAVWTNILSIESDDEAKSAFPGLYAKKSPEMLAENQPSWIKENESAKKDKVKQEAIKQELSNNDVPIIKKKAVYKSCFSMILSCGCATLILAALAFGIFYYISSHKLVKIPGNFQSAFSAASGSEPSAQSRFKTYEFGNYPAKADGSKEPIVWDIVDEKDGVLTLVAHNIVDEFSATTTGSDYDKQSDNSTSIVWLNFTFYKEAFSDKEKAQVLCDKNVVPYKREKTRVKLLSESDLDKYYLNSEDRIAKPTEYAADKLLKKDVDKKDLFSYWINSENGFSIVDKNGNIRGAEPLFSTKDNYGFEIFKPYGMRPMIRIKKPVQKDS
ncbi:MAG: hypothetical protein K6G50_07940 [bacterium]|nr:hypothetical protein [bacterium]